MKNNSFIISLAYALLFLVACIDMFFRYHTTEFAWHDKLLFACLIFGLISSTRDAIFEYKNRKNS